MKTLTIEIPLVRAARTGAAILLAAALFGCDRDDVKVYQVPKEASAPTPQNASTMPSIPGEVPAQPNLTWTLPEGWQEVPAGQMRLASFAVAGTDGTKADVSIVPLGGSAGGDLSNVNRWRGQVGLPPIAEEELSKLGEKVEVAGKTTTLYDFAGGKTRILVTTLQRDDMSWFFKMTGDNELLGQQKQKFVVFLKSVKFGSGAAAQTELPPDHPPIGGPKSALPPDHPSLGAMPDSVSLDNPTKPQWTVPESWKEEPPTQMLLAKFSTSDKDARAEITVSSFPGDVGGLAANINRWCRQVGLPPMDDAAVARFAKPLDVQSEKASLVEMDGKSARLIGVIVPHGDQTWFFKMMGDAKTVNREQDAFIKFVQTVKFPHAP